MVPVFFLFLAFTSEYCNEFCSAHGRGRRAKGGLGLKDYLHLGHGWLCCRSRKRLEVSHARPGKRRRSLPHTLFYHVTHRGTTCLPSRASHWTKVAKRINWCMATCLAILRRPWHSLGLCFSYSGLVLQHCHRVVSVLLWTSEFDLIKAFSNILV